MIRCVGWGVLAGALMGLVIGRDTGKTQFVRAVDVLALGPFMVWASIQPGLSRASRLVLSMAGAATVTFNAVNFFRERAARSV